MGGNFGAGGKLERLGGPPVFGALGGAPPGGFFGGPTRGDLEGLPTVGETLAVAIGGPCGGQTTGYNSARRYQAPFDPASQLPQGNGTYLLLQGRLWRR